MPIKMFFYFMMILGTMITLSSTNWVSAWIGLELNLLSFIPLIMHNSNQQSNEAALKYFLTQTFASIFLLTSAMLLLILNINILSIPLTSIILMLAISLKMGAAPLHFWFPAIMQGLSWLNCFILMTWQKLAPLFLMMTMNSPITMIMALTSSWIGALGGYNQMLIKKILAYSSINHLGWMITSTNLSENYTMIYFFIYSILNVVIISMTSKWNINHLAQMPTHEKSKNINLMMITNLLSLGGLPPFLGFLPKWIIIYQLSSVMPIQMFIITMSSLLTLYFYLRISYNLMLKSPSTSPIMTLSPSKMISSMTIISALGMMIMFPLM